ncbi:MAG: hypothetical protein ABS23_03840 [SAR92 bacterium BACL16 MAG-120619-bin48]|jgi:hypothetical protein|nr:MAG: hypothetical protein ABS23_03840 [SAR92 bacterium BACL16 MAG-120619-bin48]|tara:strand:- start:1835 stop:2737 length:903 start_codon:yes stop_codon:yes gene_type:complete
MKTGAIIPPLIALFFVVLTGCSTPKVVGDAASAPVALPPLAKRQVSYRVAPLGQTDLVFIGQPRSSGARSTPSGMAYPGGDPFSFLAAIAVHAAIQGSVTSAAEQAQIEAANKVLTPFKELIDGLYQADLLSANQLAGISEKTDDFEVGLLEDDRLPTGWLVQLNPMFVMSRSSDAITAVVTLAINDGRIREIEASAAPYQKVIAIQSQPVANTQEWLKEEGAKFTDTLQDLVSAAIELGINQFAGLLPPKEEASSTLRYLENGEKKIERGYLISESCSALIFESLRGELKWIPKNGPCG